MRVHLQRAPLIGREDVWQQLLAGLQAFPQQGQVIVLDKANAGVGATRVLHDFAAQIADHPTLFVRHEGSGLLAAWRDALREHADRVDTSGAYVHLERYLEPLFGASDPASVTSTSAPSASQIAPASARLNMSPSLNMSLPHDDHRFLMARMTAPVGITSVGITSVGVTSNVSVLSLAQAATHTTAHHTTAHPRQQRLFDVAAQLFLQTPSVLLVDDIDRADEASAQLLAHLLESGALKASLVVVAGRREGLPAVLAKVLLAEPSDPPNTANITATNSNGVDSVGKVVCRWQITHVSTITTLRQGKVFDN